jgi:Asp-tRNA(Asn)/Glu-tRNA(Gln) amidotransferase B subunit
MSEWENQELREFDKNENERMRMKKKLEAKDWRKKVWAN